ncbi:MAG: DegQ family serine endoprotease [Gammaproteobacteria bacterium]
MLYNKNKSSVFLVFLISLLLLIPLSSQAAFPWSSGSERPTLAPMIKKTTPAIVNISTKSTQQIKQNPLFNDPFFRRFFDAPQAPPQQRQSQSMGSGVILDSSKGYILTNNHVIANADEIMVTLHDKRSFEAKLIGTDPEADLAVIQIKAKDLVQLELADSATLQVGDFVVAIGNPFGLEQTVTSGIISALGRSGLGIEGYENFIQTDASINPGNSGGALVDLDGKLVGINTAIVGPSGGNVGIGFAIPSNMAKSIMSQLVEYGEVRRGLLGVMIQDVTPDLAKALGTKQNYGAAVTQIIKSSAAEKAGIKVGDVITDVNDKKVKNASQLRNAIGLLRIGEKLKLNLIRDGADKTIYAKLSKPKQTTAKAEDLNKKLAGAVLGDINAGHPLSGKVDGVEVISIERGSPAANAGLLKGDIIVSVNRYPVKTVADVKKYAGSGGGILLNIQRGNGALFLFIR